MPYPSQKTRIVCTIGPASSSPDTLDAMLEAGMTVARLNFSHGDFDSHAQTIRLLREASQRTGRPLAIMADLPGPKMRIGDLCEEPVELAIGDSITLTTDEEANTAERVSVTFCNLPRAVHPGDKLFLNDGLISLKVVGVTETDVRCEVRAGGELRSRKGLNLPGIDLGMSAFTERDRECLAFALEQGLDAVSQSFVNSAADLEDLRRACEAMGYPAPFVIAKIERAGALECLEEILDVADGLMVARGDLGVEIPIARISVVQKQLMRTANRLGKPVITATQMLESMIEHRRPTRAEATDVANAILDGTDAVMLSAESAMGRYPVEAVQMLAEIARETEPHRAQTKVDQRMRGVAEPVDLIAHNVQQTIYRACPAALVVPTRSGTTARSIARFRLPLWLTAFTTERSTAQALLFSAGVQPVLVEHDEVDWSAHARAWLAEACISEGMMVLVQGPSPDRPCANHRMELVELGEHPC